MTRIPPTPTISPPDRGGRYPQLTADPAKTHLNTTGAASPLSDRVSLSRAKPEADASAGSSDSASNPAGRPTTDVETQSQYQQLLQLQSRDQEVRAHEQAHLAVAGPYARGGAAYVYQRGSDGRLYAVGGEVAIDVGKERTPEATIRKMQTVRRAALAPLNPSAADRQIAARASLLLAQAQQELQMAGYREEPGGGHVEATGSGAAPDDSAAAAIERNRGLRSIQAYQQTSVLFDG